MFILYVLECMLFFFVFGLSDEELLLITTGSPMNISDFLVGLAGWMVLSAIVFGVIISVKYLRNRNELKKRWRINGFTGKKDFFKCLIISLCFGVVGLGIGLPLYFLFTSEMVKIVGSIIAFIGGVCMIGGALGTLYSFIWKNFSVKQ